MVRAEEKLRALRERLGQAACHLVRINSGSGDPKASMGYEGLWRAHLRSCVPGGGAGEPEARPAVPAQVRHGRHQRSLYRVWRM